MTTTYDSHAVRESDWPWKRWWFDEHGATLWEKLPPRNGIIYLRRHVSGPLNTTSPGWLPA